jgi:hypothetical protein
MRSFDDWSLIDYLRRQWRWSYETFGPATRTHGILDHITKEIEEVRADPHDLAEWTDLIILSMDGFWRHGGTAKMLIVALEQKQRKNMARQWPDWRAMSEDRAIEHVRNKDKTSDSSTSTVKAEPRRPHFCGSD